jgi:hypothetical protein
MLRVKGIQVLVFAQHVGVYFYDALISLQNLNAR